MAFLSAATVALIAPPAQAETWRGADAHHDVTSHTHSPQPPPCGTDSVGTDPDDELRDITGLRVTHEGDAITVRVTMRRLTGRGIDTSWLLHLRVPAGAFLVHVTRQKPGGKLMTILSNEPQFPPPDECGNAVVLTTGGSCSDMGTVMDRPHDSLVTTIPRQCLKAPRWVQVGANVFGVSGTSEDYTTLSDEWAEPGDDTSGFVPPYGPRVHRG